MKIIINHPIKMLLGASILLALASCSLTGFFAQPLEKGE
jgi:hypothetical protein